MRRSEVTYLGVATDVGMVDLETKPAAKSNAVMSSSPAPLKCSLNGFQMTVSDVQVTVAGASTLRFGHTALSEAKLVDELREARSTLAALDQKLVRNAYIAESRVGTKVAELLREVNTMIKNDSASKCVVFSQFLGVLDVCSAEFTSRGIGIVRLDGSSKQHERADALMEFSSNPKIKVFLLSMRAGSVGLTLTSADHCFIMDVTQNSAIEEQAIDRIHR
jgi:SNF2 family DNA or RNA helicase